MAAQTKELTARLIRRKNTRIEGHDAGLVRRHGDGEYADKR